MKLHLDTDIGGDIDDFCALAMLLQMPDVDLLGVTTVAELGGKRAGYVRHVLRIVQRSDVPVAAGADVSLGRYRDPQVLLDEERYWGQAISPAPNPLHHALELLKQNIEQGATVVGIGPYTNLHLLEERYPGILRDVSLFLMGGYVYPIEEGFPLRSNESDYNIQVDAEAAYHVLQHSSPTLVPLTITVRTALRKSYLPRLQGSGTLGQLLARQAEEFARDIDYAVKYGESTARVPSDIISFQHDPLACAIAVGWNDRVQIEQVPLKFEIRDGWMYETIDSPGKPTRIVTSIDATRFNEFWLDTVTRGKR